MPVHNKLKTLTIENCFNVVKELNQRITNLETTVSAFLELYSSKERLQEKLAQTVEARKALGAKPFKDQNDKLKLAYLEIEVGRLLSLLDSK